MNVRRARRVALIGTAVAALAAIIALGGGRMGIFSGSPPADLGVREGKLRAGDGRPNWVSSQAAADDAKHHVAPIAFADDAGRAWERLITVILAEPRASIVTRGPGYLHVEFRSRALGFVDDAQFALDAGAGVIHVHSGARLGVRDFGVNRERIERIRASLSPGSGAAGPR